MNKSGSILGAKKLKIGSNKNNKNDHPAEKKWRPNEKIYIAALKTNSENWLKNIENMYKKRSPGEPAPQKTHKKAEKRCPGVKKMSGSGRKNARWEIKNWRARKTYWGPKWKNEPRATKTMGTAPPLIATQVRWSKHRAWGNVYFNWKLVCVVHIFSPGGK